MAADLGESVLDPPSSVLDPPGSVLDPPGSGRDGLNPEAISITTRS
jgi:hypothetical protein